MSDWFEDEELWRIFGDCMFGEERFTAAAEQIDDILALFALPPQAILDLGCGPGRHAIPLAQGGFDVTALDLSEHLLELGRARAAAAGAELNWIQSDMRHYDQPSAFDLVVSMWTSFGYFDDPIDDQRVLRKCRENLRPGGSILIDVVGKEYVCRHLQPVHLTEFDNGDILIERPLLEAQMTRYSNQWLLLRDGAYHVAEWHHNLYSGQEMAGMLERAGFVNVRLFGDLRGNQYDLDSERLVAVAERPN